MSLQKPKNDNIMFEVEDMDNINNIKIILIIQFNVMFFLILFFYIWSLVFNPSFQDGMKMSFIFALSGILLIIGPQIYSGIIKKQINNYGTIIIRIGWSTFLSWGLFAALSKLFLN